jgi:hypothetical protein
MIIIIIITTFLSCIHSNCMTSPLFLIQCQCN